MPNLSARYADVSQQLIIQMLERHPCPPKIIFGEDPEAAPDDGTARSVHTVCNGAQT
jgi:hypothetical protein